MIVQEHSTERTGESPTAEACWALLERIAVSEQLRRAVRLQELLFYMGRRSLKEGCERIHEQEIGASVFRRPVSYDTSADNIVRTNVSDLRKRIEAYFNADGAHESILVEIPRGSYVPVFRPRAADPNQVVEIPTPLPLPLIEPAAPVVSEAEVPINAPQSGIRQGNSVALIVACILLLAASAGCLYFWSQYRALRASLFAWQDKPAVAAFWSRFLGANPDTDLVVSDSAFGLAQTLSGHTFSLNDYLSRSYFNQVNAMNLSPDKQAAVNRVLSWNLASPDEFILARRILGLDPLGRYLRLYNARNYMPELINRDNVILIGAQKANPWDELFNDRMNFVVEFDKPRVVNRSPAAGEQPVYLPAYSNGYCVVAFMPNSNNTGLVLLIEGTNAEASEAAGDFLLSEDQLSDFKKMLHVTTLPYFQVLLKVSAVRGTPLNATIVAYRIIAPNQ